MSNKHRHHQFCKIAQKSQMILPGMYDIPGEKPSRDAIYSRPTGYKDGEYYYICHLCNKPLLDKNGNFISDPEDVPVWITQKTTEEISPSFTIDKNYVLETLDSAERIINLFIEAVNQAKLNAKNEIIRSVVQPYLDKHKNNENIPTNEYLNYSGEYNHILNDILSRNIQLVTEKIQSNSDWSSFVERASKIIKTKISGSLQGYLRTIAQTIKSIERAETNGSWWFGDINKDNADQILNRFVLVKTVGQYFEDALKNNLNYAKNLIKVMPAEATYHEHGERRSKVKVPACDSCSKSYQYSCSVEGCRYKSIDMDDFVEIDDELLCPNHGYTCNSCDRSFDDEDRHRITYDGDTYCNECFYEYYNECSECQEIIDRDYTYYEEGGDEPLCESCYEKTSSKVFDTDQQKAVEEIIEAKDHYYPIDQKSIEEKVIPALQAAVDKKVEPTKLIEWLDKRNVFGANKTLINAAISTEIENGMSVEVILQMFKKQLEEYARWKTDYTGLEKTPKFFPVEIQIEGAHTGKGKVFVIYPSEKLFQFANKINPTAKEVYDKFIKNSGHHRGALAYVRVNADSDGNLLVNNLQTDIDVQKYTGGHSPMMTKKEFNENKALKWWISSIEDFWIPYLLDFIKQIGTSLAVKTYLTTYEMQKSKWPGLPERNKITYDVYPERMGFPIESIHTSPEMMGHRKYDMRRIAEEYYNCFKLIKSYYN